jgi:hypothetical protein
MAPNGLPSKRFTPDALQAWRIGHGLFIREMAHAFGFSVGRLKDKLYGRTPITEQVDRLTEMTDLLLHRGIRPPAWPDRLARRIHANIVGYNDRHSAQNRDSSPTESP